MGSVANFVTQPELRGICHILRWEWATRDISRRTRQGPSLIAIISDPELI